LRPPQVEHVFVSWTQPSVASVQAWFAQQGCPMAPQVRQVLVASAQPSVGSLHVSLSQHGSPVWPQPQTPFSQDAPPGQAATQVPSLPLQQPSLQVSPPQQRSPAPPHAVQT
jgi:hypothetical protein